MGIIEGAIMGAGAVLIGHARHSILLESCRVKNPPFSGSVFLYKGKYYYHDLYVEKYADDHKGTKLNTLKKWEADYLKASSDPLEDNPEFQRANLDAIQCTIRLLGGTPEAVPPYEWKDASCVFVSPSQHEELMQLHEEQAAVSSPSDLQKSSSTPPPESHSQIANQRAALQAKLAYVGDQITTLELRMANRFDGEPTEEGVAAALQQHLITEEQAEKAYKRIRQNTILQEHEKVELDSFIQQATALSQELDNLSPASKQQTFSHPMPSKKRPLTVVFGIVSAVLLVAVIVLSIQLSNAKSTSIYLAANADNYITALSSRMELMNDYITGEISGHAYIQSSRVLKKKSDISIYSSAYQSSYRQATSTSESIIPDSGYFVSVYENTYHRANCPSLKSIAVTDLVFYRTEAEVKNAGFSPCPKC